MHTYTAAHRQVSRIASQEHEFILSREATPDVLQRKLTNSAAQSILRRQPEQKKLVQGGAVLVQETKHNESTKEGVKACCRNKGYPGHFRKETRND